MIAVLAWCCCDAATVSFDGAAKRTRTDTKIHQTQASKVKTTTMMTIDRKSETMTGWLGPKGCLSRQVSLRFGSNPIHSAGVLEAFVLLL